MMDREEEFLLESYMEEADIITKCYDMMGRLLDLKQIEKRMKELGIKSMYIYGGGYLGIQLYHAVERTVKVISIVDKNGRLMIDVPDVPVMDMDLFKQNYRGQIVIVTPIKYFKDICAELYKIVPKEKILLLHELLEGK